MVTRARRTESEPLADPGNTRLQDLGDILVFMRSVWALSHGLQASSKRMIEELGVTGPQRLVIRLVGCRPGISAGDLSSILHLHPSTLTGILRRLEERGLVARSVAPDDRRRAVLRLTPAGRAIDARRHGSVEAAIRRVLGRLPAEEVASTRRLLSELARELDPEGL